MGDPRWEVHRGPAQRGERSAPLRQQLRAARHELVGLGVFCSYMFLRKSVNARFHVLATSIKHVQASDFFGSSFLLLSAVWHVTSSSKFTVSILESRAPFSRGPCVSQTSAFAFEKTWHCIAKVAIFRQICIQMVSARRGEQK